MIGVLILTHGRLADELLAAARVIAGDLPGFEAMALEWGATPEAALGSIESALNEFETPDGILILTDMYGSTPTNLAMKLCKLREDVEVISGVNLPMVVRLACARKHQMNLMETTEWICSKAKSSICTSCRDQPQPGHERSVADECAGQP